jgi:hypothetical protein
MVLPYNGLSLCYLPNNQEKWYKFFVTLQNACVLGLTQVKDFLMISRQKIAKKRSLQKVNEHFEQFYNAESAKKTSTA